MMAQFLGLSRRSAATRGTLHLSGRCNTTGCGKMGIAQPPWVKKGQDGSCQTVKPGNMCVFSASEKLGKVGSMTLAGKSLVPNSFIHESPTTELAT